MSTACHKRKMKQEYKCRGMYILNAMQEDHPPKYSKACHTPTRGETGGGCYRRPTGALLTRLALSRRAIQQTKKFASFSCLRWVLIHHLQACAHTVIRRSTGVRGHILGFFSERVRSRRDICRRNMHAGNARANVQAHANARACDVRL